MKNNEEIDVTIMMPCLNEEETLVVCIDLAKQTIAELNKHGLSGEILISDNGSTDQSIDIAKQMNCHVVHCAEKGYGNALINGGKEARGRFIVIGDSDASYDFRESIPMILKLKDGYDLCMGNRFLGKIEKGAMPWKNKHIGNPALSGILNLFFNSGINDAHCGLRAFTKDAFLKMNLESGGMELASEIVVKSALLGLKTTEIPVTLRKDGRTRPPHLKPWGDGWRHLKFLFMLSPKWLYFIPSLSLLALSTFIFIALLATTSGEVFTLGSFWIGDHWMILASGFFITGYGGIIFGLTALAYSSKKHLRKISPFVKKIYKLASVENSIILGVILLITSLIILISVVTEWINLEFGELGRIREMVVITTLAVSGFMTIFGGFLINMVRESR